MYGIKPALSRIMTLKEQSGYIPKNENGATQHVFCTIQPYFCSY